MQPEIKSTINLSFGYGLILVGIVIMFISFFQVYRVYTKQSEMVQFFNFPGVTIDLSKLVPKPDTSALTAMTKQLNLPSNLIPQQTETAPMETEIISSAMLNASANLGAFIIFMSFILNFGSKLCSIGIQLVTAKV